MQQSIKTATTPLWFWLVAGLGLVWNIYGVYQFSGTLRSTPESLQAMGMTAEQAQVYASYPWWMTVAFAIGVFAGTIGCIALLMRNRVATPIFLASVIGYCVLCIGDITEGVFAALGSPQIIVLSVVVAIAVGLFLFSRWTFGSRRQTNR